MASSPPVVRRGRRAATTTRRAACGVMRRPSATPRKGPSPTPAPAPKPTPTPTFSRSRASHLGDVPLEDRRPLNDALDVLPVCGLGREQAGRNIGHGFEGALLDLGRNLLAVF